MKKQSKNQKRLIRILIAALLFVAGLLLEHVFRPFWVITLVVFLASFAVSGYDVIIKAVKNIFRGKVFDENFLMALATVGAFFVGQYPEGVAVMLFYQVGELFQSYAVEKSRKSISGLMDIRPDYATVLQDGEEQRLDPDEVEVGETILIRPGEKIPLDAVVLSGSSSINTAALTGESLPREVSEKSEVLSGCININGVLTAKVTKEFGESTVSKILDLVENASSKKAESENFITKFARYYTPIVVVAAAILAVLPPLITGQPFGEWIYRALVFLVISCPCALVISIPLSFFGGIGGASKLGVLVKGGNYIEALSKAETVVFDKTGTLTKGSFRVQQTFCEGISQQELLRYAAFAESYSNHPISASLKEAYGGEIETEKIGAVKEVPGQGVCAEIEGKQVLAGNAKLMRANGISFAENDTLGTVVYLAVAGEYKGCILIADEVKPDAKKAIAALKAAGIKQTVMLTGDSKAIGESVAKELGLDAAYTELLPGGKVEQVEQLLSELSPKGKLCFVGDGVNDAPVLARADIGIAMGGLGSDAAIEAADVVIMTDEPSKISTAIGIAKRTLRIVKENIIFALGIKFLVLILGALGFASMWAAVFADVGVSVLAILNAMRMLRVKKYK